MQGPGALLWKSRFHSSEASAAGGSRKDGSVRRLGTGEGADILTAQQGILRKKTGMEQDAEKDTFLTAAGISIMHPPGIDEETVSFL